MYKFLAILLLFTGAVLVTSAAFPILHYEIISKSHFSKRQQLLSPLSSGQNTKHILGAHTTDYTRASTWFDNTQVGDQPTPTNIAYYQLSIPKLKINRATVEIGGEDLSKNLIQYQGTALPGRRGNPVIFGHSVLPQFFNPKNYLTIFSTLPTLEAGDDIFIDYDGITYHYTIVELFEVTPTTVEVLRQTYDKPHLTLVTCVPPGTYLRRLIVRADLVPPQL